MAAISSPLEAADVRIRVTAGRISFHELADAAGASVPKIDAGAKGNGKKVLRAPVKKIEVVVVDKLGRIKDALGLLGHAPIGALAVFGSGGGVGRVEAVESEG
jgi:hypothetical protein